MDAYLVFTLILMMAFVGVVFWVFAKKRKKTFEQDGDIPFQDKS